MLDVTLIIVNENIWFGKSTNVIVLCFYSCLWKFVHFTVSEHFTFHDNEINIQIENAETNRN